MSKQSDLLEVRWARELEVIQSIDEWEDDKPKITFIGWGLCMAAGFLLISVLLCFPLRLFIYNGLPSGAMIVFDLIDVELCLQLLAISKS